MSNDCWEDGFLSQFTLERLRLRAWARENRVPVSMTWELTPYCNLNCPMCYVHLTPAQAAARGRQLTAAEWLTLGQQFADMGLMFLNLSGGEPLVRPDFWEIYEGVSRLGIFPSVFTNGCLIDERAVEHFVKFPPRSVKMSLYGASDETYERMCGVKHGFEKAARAIELMAAANINLMVTTTVVKDNRDDLDAMGTFCQEHGILLHATDHVLNSVRGADTDADANRSEISPAPMDLASLEKKRRKNAYDPRLFSACSTFGGQGMITWQGHLQVCAFFEHEYVALQPPYNAAEAWRTLMEQMDAARKPQECLDCPDAPFCRMCPGELAAASGYMDRIDPARCVDAAMRHKAYREALERGETLPEPKTGQ